MTSVWQAGPEAGSIDASFGAATWAHRWLALQLQGQGLQGGQQGGQVRPLPAPRHLHGRGGRRPVHSCVLCQLSRCRACQIAVLRFKFVTRSDCRRRCSLPLSGAASAAWGAPVAKCVSYVMLQKVLVS